MYGWGDLAKPATRSECALVKGVGADGNVKLCFARCASWSTARAALPAIRKHF